jgi:hypothetical protein
MLYQVTMLYQIAILYYIKNIMPFIDSYIYQFFFHFFSITDMPKVYQFRFQFLFLLLKF